MLHRVSRLQAHEILDSRGRPTLCVTVELESGAQGQAGVPSGASTGRREAVELRDGDPGRFGGAGVLKAAGHVNGEIADTVVGQPWKSLADLDQALIDLDGSPNKARLGANAVVGTSMAVARAMARAEDRSLYEFLAPPSVAPRLPVPHFNVVNGGAHARTSLAFQEFMLAPLGARSLSDGVRAGAEIYAGLRRRLAEAGLSTGVGDEGGFAPDIVQPEDVLELLTGAISDAGYSIGRDGVALALDPAASGFRQSDGTYAVGGEALSSADMIERYRQIVARYPVWSIEDGLGEDDPEGWRRLTDSLGDRIQIVGDDLLVTNPALIRAAVTGQLANAVLIKVNQIGTVTETLEAMAVCRQAGWGQMISHRSGETSDSFIADLAVATGCGQIKAGAPSRGERVAKYNRLLEVERECAGAPYGVAERERA